MKYGEQFERESVPQWSLHNIDYNSLKHYIKAHTTKDQATAIAIPGRPNTALTKFEDDFYSELCRQHDRVGLFVSSKADEISRRLQHLSNQIHRLILRCATSGQERMPLKRRQRFVKYEQTLLQCGDDIKSLQRFVDAQVVAFRKILKKYRKWTGSSALGHRFKENILSQPKSFTRRDFSRLQTQHDDLLLTLHSALPAAAPGGLALPDPATLPPRPPSSQVSPSETVVATEPQPSAGYWNEYECGSEAGDFDGNADNEYAIYIDPNADDSIPGMKALSQFFSKPIHKLSAWVTQAPSADPPNPERDPLLPTHHNHRPTSTSSYGATRTPPELSYFSTPPGATYTSNTTAAGTETDLDESDAHTATSPSSRFPSNRHSRRGSGSFSRSGYTSSPSDDQHLPGSAQGYSTYYTLPSIADQRAARARERALRWATAASFGVAFVLTGIAALLIATGRHKMRLEVDAGVTVGIVTSLGAACAGLCMAGARRDRVGVVEKVAVWAAFAGVCVVNGVLLVLVMGNAARL